MAKKPFVPVGPGGNLYVPNKDPEKDDKIMQWQFDPTTKGGFGTPRTPNDTLHYREEDDTNPVLIDAIRDLLLRRGM
jgi:hypothetical protein